MDIVLAVEQKSAVTVISVRGELDRLSVARLEELAERPTGRASYAIVLDLSNCTYCDSSALSLFVQMHQRLNGRFAFVLPEEHVLLRNLLELVGMTQLISMFPSVESAARALSDDS